MKIMTWDKAKRRKVFCGVIIGGVFHRKVKPSHVIQFCNCYGIQEDAIRQLVENGVTRIWLEEEDRILETKLKDWLEPEIKTIEQGHGKQRIFSIDKMEVRQK